MKKCILISTLFLSACYSSSPIIQAGKDTYMVSSHVAACVSCSASVQSLTEANEFCAKQGKVVALRNTESTTNKFGYEVGNRTIFSCISENDPENTRTTLRKDAGVVTIENK